MDNKSKKSIVIILSALGVGCLLLICVSVPIYLLLFGAGNPLVTAAPIETTALTANQLAQCREVMGIKADVELVGEYYLYTPGFLDDSLECRVRVHTDNVEEIFDLSIIDPMKSGSQQLAPGRFVELTISKPEPGPFIIEGFWFQT